MKTVQYEIVGRYDHMAEPVRVSVPYRKGELKASDAASIEVFDDAKVYPSQKKIVSCYGDGSVRYLLVNFLADIKANRASTFYVDRTERRVERFTPVSLSRMESGELLIETGVVSLVLGTPGKAQISTISYKSMKIESSDIEGMTIYDAAGKGYRAYVGSSGWDVIEEGPVRTFVRTRGRHLSEDGSTFFDYETSIIAYAGSDYIRIAHQIINTEKSRTERKNHLTLTNEQAGLKYDTNYPYEMLTGAEFRLHLADRAVSKGIYTSSFNNHAESVGEGGTIEKSISADTIVDTANEMFPEVLFSTFAAGWKGEKVNVVGSLYQAYQNFPKALKMDDDEMLLSLYPRSYAPLKFPQGVAKTLRFDLLFTDSDLAENLLFDKLLTLEMPPVGTVTTRDYIDAGVFGCEVSEFYHYPTERFLYRFIDSRAKGLGFLHFGDCPEWEYVKQGRSKGRDIWINNEYDMPHNFMVMFARTGDRRYFDYIMASVRHWMDVDFCHFSEDPYHKGLLYTHSVEHVSGQPVPSHQWVEGFLDYYHLTGDPSALEAAKAIGEGLLELIKLPIYNRPGQIEPREQGWALRGLLALYTELDDERYLEACRPIVQTYIKWAELFGSWTSPYPDNYLDRVPFMMHVGLVGLHSYYKLAGGEDVKKTLLTVIDDIVRECLNPRLNMFLGKMHPSIRFQNLNGMVLESLEIAYELTGDVSYLRKGLGMFSWMTVENQPPIYDFSKLKRDDFTVIYNCPVGPKRAAQSLIPLLRYYSAAMKEGLLPYQD